MRTVGIKTLKDKLSEYIRMASSGEIILISDRDRVVAELSPPRPGRAERINDVAMVQAIREGVISAATLAADAPIEPIGQALGDVAADLRADRDAR